jgi:TolB-like protein/DNA-binding winged helix-turn-helix (wHTH) protein/Tfp pilus assembly protein PilF
MSPTLGEPVVVSRPVKPPEPVRFEDDFELDVCTYELRRSGRRLKLERIPMELLLLLVEHRGQTVTREQIVERVWGKDVFLDTDNSINSAIRKIRQVLKDDPDRPRFVQTVTGTGYRFIAPVREAAALTPPLQVVAGQPTLVEDRFGTETRRDGAPRVRGSRIQSIFLVSFVVLLGGLVAYFQLFRFRVHPQPASGRLMLAVLPFQNLTGDAGQEYFSDGLTEEMIARLGSLDPQHLGVIARTSVMHYKNSQEKLDQIGRELGVRYVLEGSVRREVGKVRISAQLIQVNDQTHLWARQFDRELSGLLSLQSEITREISGEIQVALGNRKPIQTPLEPSSSPQSYEAYDLYLKGQYFWNKRTVEGFRRAIDYFQRAVDKDPNYARAYAGLADSYALIGGYSLAPQAEFIAKARAAALRALEIDDSLAEAHTALALIVQNYDWDWQTADKEFRRAIELNPNYATGHHWYAEHLTWMGRFDVALRESEQARQLDPLSLIIAADNAAFLYYSRQYDRAIEQFRAVRELDPGFPRSGIILQVYAEKGMFAEAVAEVENGRKVYGDAPSICWELAYLYGRTGRQAEARQELAKLEQWNRRQPLDAVAFIIPYIGMGDKDQAFTWLEKAYAQHSNAITTLKVDPVYDPLRDDPRFQNLLRRIGLAQ